MKMKKLISFLCAAALTVSSFAGLAVTASAETPKSVTVAVDAGDTTANVTTTESSAVTGVLLLAKYSNNALTSLKVSTSFTTPANDVALGAAYADGDKLMAWEDLASMKPITVTRVAKPVPKTAVNTVAELAVTATNNSKAPATITAAVTAKQGAEFTDTNAFTYTWTKDGVDANTTGAIIENAAAGTYTVTATYNGTGNYEGSLGPVSITIQAADDNRTNLSTAATVTVTPAGTVYTNTELTAAVTIPGAEEGDPATTVPAADLDYAWYVKGDNDAWTAVDDATEASFTPTDAGTYKVTVTAKAASEDYVGTKDSAEVAVAKAPTVITPDATYVSFTKDGDVDNTGIDYRSAVAANDGKLKIGYAKISGGYFTANNVKWDDQANVGIMSIDASTYAGKIKKATLNLGVNTESNYNLNVRFAKTANYINIADVEENAFTATGLSALTGTIDSSNIVVVGQSTQAGKDIQCDITPLLRGAEDGKVTIGLFTDGGHSVFVNTYTVDIECADDDLAAAAVKVNQVYNDGTDTVAIPTTTETADGINWAAGDVYTTSMAAAAANGTYGRKTFANVIDQKTGDPAAKYVYASGAANNQTLVAGDNTINLVYNQYKYATATFTAKVGTDAKAGVPIVISADAALTDGTTYESKTVTTSTDGTISEVLLPGAYKWTVEATGAYEGANGTFTVANDGAAVPVAVNLTGKTQTLTDVTLDTSKLNTGILTTSQATKNVGTISSTQVDETGVAMATQQAVTYSVTPADKGVSISSAGVVTITNETPAGDYVIKATAGGVTTKDASAYTMTVAATGTETVAAWNDDFEGETNMFGASKAASIAASAATVYTPVKYGGWNGNHALVVSKATATASTPTITLDSNDTVLIKYREYNGWFTNSETNTVTVKSGSKELVSYTYNVNNCNITDVKINGTTASGFAAFHAQSNYNGSGDANGWEQEKNGADNKSFKYFASETYNPVVEIKVKGDGSVEFNHRSPAAKSNELLDHKFTGNIGEAVTNVDNITITSTISNSGRASGIDNVTTTITRTAAPTPAAKTITWANTLTGFTVKKGNSAIDSGATLAANDVITIEATAGDKKVKSVTATGADFTVNEGVATTTVGATPADIVITAVELEDKTTPAQASSLVFATVADDYEAFGKKASDIGTFTITADSSDATGKTYILSGTSKYIADYSSGFGTEDGTDMSKGNYVIFAAKLPNDFAGDETKATLKYGSNKSAEDKYSKVYASDKSIEPVMYLYSDTTELYFTIDLDGAEGTAYTPTKYTVKLAASDGTPAFTREAAPTPVTAVAITGTPKLGETLTAATTPAEATVTYQWQRADAADGTYTNIEGATAATYMPVEADMNKYLKVVATAGTGYTGKVTSDATAQVAEGLVPLSDGDVVEFTLQGDSGKIKANTYDSNHQVYLYATTDKYFDVADASNTKINNNTYNKKYVKTAGKGTLDTANESNTTRVLKVKTVENGVLEVDFGHGGSAGAEARYLTITQDSDTNEAAVINQKIGDVTENSNYVKIDVEKGKDIYITSGNSSLSIFGIRFTADADVTDTFETGYTAIQVESNADDAGISAVSFQKAGGEAIAATKKDNSGSSKKDYYWAKITETGTYNVNVTYAENFGDGGSTKTIEVNDLKGVKTGTLVSAATTSDKPDTAVVSGAETVNANSETTYSVQLKKGDSPSTYSDVTTDWKVYTTYTADTKTEATNSSFDGNKLTVNLNETAAKLYIVATVADSAESEKFETITTAPFEVTVNTTYIQQTFSFVRPDGTTELESGYVVATEGDANTFSLTALLEIATGVRKYESAIVNGAATLNLNPNKKYTLAVYTDDTKATKVAEFTDYAPTKGAATTPVKETITAAATPDSTALATAGVTSITPANAIVGDTVTVTPTADAAAIITGITVNDDNNIEVTDNGDGTYSFTVPAGGITSVAVNKTAIYAVKIADVDPAPAVKKGDDNVANGDMFAAGTEITVTPAEKTGYTASISVKDADDADVTVSEAGVFTMPAKAVTIIVSYTINTYTVTFNVDGGSEVAAATVNHGEKVTKPADPTKDEKVFDGWYADEDLTTAFDFDNTTITAATTIYAKWNDPAPTTFAVTVTVPEKGVASVNLKKGEEAVGEAVTTFTENKAVFENLEAGEYTIVATAKDGYTISAIKVGGEAASTVTITDADVSDVTIETATKWQAMGTPADGSNSIAVDDNGVTTLSITKGQKVGFYYDLGADLGAAMPATWAAATGDLVVEYELKVASDSSQNGDWFVDLSTNNESIGSWHGSTDTAVFGRFAGYGVGKVDFLSGGTATNSDDTTKRYSSKNGTADFGAGEWHKITNRVNLDMKNIFAASYNTGSDNTMHYLIINSREYIDNKLFLNVGPADAAKADLVYEVKNVSVRIIPADDAKFTVSEGTLTGAGAAVSITPASARMGETITVTPTAPDGGIITDMTANGAVNLDYSTGTATFLMPAQNVTVDATVETKRVVTVTNTVTDSHGTYYQGGYLKVNGEDTASFDNGAEVTITATPYYGYKLATVTVNDGENDTQATVNGNTATFNMPNKNVTVSATWAADDNKAIIVVPSGTIDKTSGDGRAAVDGNIYVMNYVKSGVKVTYSDINYTNLAKITLFSTQSSGSKDVSVNFYKDSDTTAFATAHTNTGTSEALGTPNKNVYKAQTGDISGLSGTGSLVMALTSDSTGYIGNYWYIVLEYGTSTPEPTTYTITLPENPTGGSVAITTPNDYNASTGVAEGKEVVITATPAAGYQVKTLTVKNGDDTVADTDSDNTTYTFSMPAGNVTVTAEFEKSASLHSYVLSATSDEQNISVPIFVFK